MEVREKILKTAFKLFIERGFLEVYITDLIKEIDIDKSDFYHYFKNRNQLIYESIEELWTPYFNDIINAVDECNDSSNKKLLQIFEKYSEIESYLKNNFNVSKFNYKSLLFLTSEEIKYYKPILNLIVDFNNIILDKIEYTVEDGKRSGEILNIINSRSVAKDTLSLLQSHTVLWIMNQNIDIRLLFETSFKHLWNTIKSH